VRIRHGDELALFTVSNVVDDDRADRVRLGASGRLRLAETDAFDGSIDAAAARACSFDSSVATGTLTKSGSPTCRARSR